MRELCRQRFYIIDMASEISSARSLLCLTKSFLNTRSSFRIPLGYPPWSFCPSTQPRKKCCLFPRSSLPRCWKKPVAAGWARKKPLKFRTQLKTRYRQVLCANSFTSLTELRLHRAEEPALDCPIAEGRVSVKGGEAACEALDASSGFCYQPASSSCTSRCLRPSQILCKPPKQGVK